MIMAYAVIFVILYAVIYVVPQVSGIFVETYTAEYGILEESQESSYIAVRDEKLYVSDNSGTVKRVASQGSLMRRNTHIADVGGTKYYSQKRGLVSYYYDGLESVYTPDNMQTITEKNLELSDEEKQSYEVKGCSEGSVESGSPIFKVVDNKDWYLVCWIDAAEAESWNEGSSITVEFEDKVRIKMEISQKNGQGQKTQLILSCNRYYEKSDRIRMGSCRLIKTGKSGIILETDSITEKDGQKGVYVKSKRLDRASFVPVKVLLTSGDKTVVEKNFFNDENGNQVETVENYDEILKQPETAETTKGSEKNAD